ncbi:MAG: amino acid transporter, partial [Corynebacterium flavescens]
PVAAVTLSMIFAFGSVALQYWNPPGLLAFLFNAVGGCLLVIWIFIVCSYLKLHPILKERGELSTLRVIGFPWLPLFTLLAIAALLILMLLDPTARNQVVAVAVLTLALVVVSFLVPSVRRNDVPA